MSGVALTAAPRLRIAGELFELRGAVEREAFPPSFRPFIVEDSTSPACVVDFVGDSPELAALEPLPSEPWTFRHAAGTLEMSRRNVEGVVIWRVKAELDKNLIHVRVNPDVFERYYERYESAWKTGLGLILLTTRLFNHGGLPFHGSATSLDGSGILCVGVSGRGKSTISRLLKAAGADALTDEHPVVRSDESAPSGFSLHGTPWPSSGNFYMNAHAPLRRIYFLEHGPCNEITPLTPQAAVKRLLDVALIPWQEPFIFDPCLKTVEALLARVPVAVLSFVPDETVVEAIRGDLAGDAG